MKFFTSVHVLALGVAPLVMVAGHPFLRGTAENEEWERFLRGDDDSIPPPATPTACFSSVTTIHELNKGVIAMGDLQVGDRVLTNSGDFLPVYAFGHYEPTVSTAFLQIHTAKTSNPVEMTASHLIYRHSKGNPVRADAIQVGDYLLQNSADTDGAEVVKITTVEREGLYAPLTSDGSIVVDGVVASTYVSFQEDDKEMVLLKGGFVTGLSHHDFSHLVLSPFRMLCLGVSNAMCQQYDEDTGMPYYISYGIKLIEWCKHQTALIQALILLCFVVATGACLVLEATVGPSMVSFLALVLGVTYTVTSKYNLAIRKLKTAN